MQRRITIGLVQAVSLLIVLTLNLQADPLDKWAWRNPSPNGNSFNGVGYAGGLIVGVGNNATIMTAADLTTAWWVQQSTGTNTQNLNAVAYSPDNGTFVVVGNASGQPSPGNPKGGMILTSTDGTNWYNQGWSNGNTRNLNGVAYGAGLFAGVGTRAEIWTSPDGTNWTQRVSPQTGSSYQLNAITYRPDVGFVAVGDAVSSVAEIVTSPDGITWSLQTSGAPAYSLNGITWGYITNVDETVTTNFVTVGGKSATIGLVATSEDGTNWTKQFSSVGFDLTGRLYGTAFKPGVGYIAVGQYAQIQYSTDGTNWSDSYSDISSPFTVPGNDFGGATYVPGLDYFVAVGNYGEVETSSSNGGPGTWQARFSGRPENLYGVARGSANFVAVGNALPGAIGGQAVVFTSSKGSAWKLRSTATTPTLNRLNNVTYGANTFVAVGNAGTVISSEDEGTNWTTQVSGTGNNLNGVSYITNSVTNIFLAAGASGTILTSPDGTNWTAQTSGTANALNCSCPTYAAGVYVVAGASGTVLTSPDAASWTPGTSGITRDFNGVAYGNNNFVAACSYGYILTSPDGITWTRVPAPPLGGDNSSGRSYNTIVYINGQFVASGSSSTISSAVVTSTDGTNWVIRAIPQTGATFKAIAYAPDTYVGIGNNGMILQAGAMLGPVIQCSYDGINTLTLTWPGGGTLQAASPDVLGPYTNVPGASSPWPITPLSEPRMYFRVQDAP